MLNAVEIGQRIKIRLNEMDMKQKDLIETTDISQTALSNYTNGYRVPGAEELLKISRSLNISMEWLLTGTENTTSKLTEDERELLMLFNELPQREQIKVLGIIEEKVKEHKIQVDINMIEKTS